MGGVCEDERGCETSKTDCSYVDQLKENESVINGHLKKKVWPMAFISCP